MRIGIFAFVVAALAGLAASSAYAGCAAHTTTADAEKPSSSSMAGTVQQSKPTGG